jgi:hypothetical protein
MYICLNLVVHELDNTSFAIGLQVWSDEFYEEFVESIRTHPVNESALLACSCKHEEYI